MATQPGLVPLSDLKKFEVADDDPDVRGWKVISGDGKRIGEVKELIVDTSEMKVRYLDIKVNENFEGVADDKRLLIPVGVASLDEKEDRVYIKSIETVTLLRYPKYSGGEITRDYESSVRNAIAPSEEKESEERDQQYAVRDFYSHEHFNDDKFYGSRRKRFNRLSDINATDLLGSKPDVRGWEVVSRDGKKTGVVHEIVLDARENKMLYLDVIVSGVSSRDYRHILIPIGLAKVAEGDRTVMVNLEEDFIRNLPSYDGSNITTEYEHAVFKAVERGENENTRERERNDHERDLYKHEHYDQKRFYPHK